MPLPRNYYSGHKWNALTLNKNTPLVLIQTSAVPAPDHFTPTLFNRVDELLQHGHWDFVRSVERHEVDFEA